ncbi:alanine/glycine:cation symporter family protein [Oscillibacter sp.]|uniref:alanine/glycine:cation symporter family protein n=1 Tax=Oscillibacter sp. TaxID=1945593 RepID=UPI0028A97512|nr:alanine/glycine:cation symporter family protein [Oscillibacter sp.]
MLEIITNFVGALNGPIWGVGMLVLIVGSGLYLTIRMGFFQFAHFGDMWKRIFEKGHSESGISAFASFCTTMAMRVGTGNVAGVAVAIFSGGPGALFWMVLAGMTNSAVCFTECTLSVLYKTKIDGEYRGGGPYCAERGLKWKPYGAFLAVITMVGIAAFMPAAATNTICDGFRNALNIPMWVSALVIALIMAVVIIGGVKRISTVASYIVPFMTGLYLIAAVIIILINITKVPAMFVTVISSAFGANAVMGGTLGIAIQQGIKRGTFSSASGMGEASPTAAAAETSHPVKQGMANAAGVWLDTVIVCTASGLMILLTDAYNTSGGYVSQTFSELQGVTSGSVYFVQLACSTVMGTIAPTFIAIMLALFSFTCLISYYYEAETAAMYLFQGPGKEKIRKAVVWIMRIGMPILIFVYGNAAAGLAWDLSDLALGSITWINMVVVMALSSKSIALYKDYEAQMKAGKDPIYDVEKLKWDGVDVELWKSIKEKHTKTVS